MMTGCDSGGSSDDDGPTDKTATITAGGSDTALVVIGTDGELKTGLKVYIKTDTNTPKSTVTVTTATDASLGNLVSNAVTVTPKTDRLVITGLSVDAAGGNDKLASGNNEVKVVLKADAQQTADSGVAAHTHSGTPVVVPPETATPPAYVVVATAGDAGAETKIHYASASKVLNYYVTSGSLVTKTLDEDFDADLIAVLSILGTGDAIQFEGTTGAADTITFSTAPTVPKLQTALDAVSASATTPTVTLGGSTQTTTIGASDTVTIPAGVTVTVDAGNILGVAGTLAFTDNTSVLALIGAAGELKATATTAKFHANATTTTGADLSLTVTAGTLTPATGWTTADASAPASVTFTSATADAGTGTAYVLGNASLAINNASTAHPVTPIVSTAVTGGSEAAGGIKAAASSAVVITGKATI
jgi:hypothetical protein